MPISTLSARNVQCCCDVKGAPRRRAWAGPSLSLMAHGRAGDKQRQRLKEGLPGPLGSLHDPAVLRLALGARL